MNRRISVNDVDYEDISIRISGEDVQFTATGHSITIYINEDEANKLIALLQTILQDRELRKGLYKKS